ncbi:14639_t:CDS:2, partial [Cetraspora pellucida]
ICVSPLKYNDTCITIQKKKHSPHNANDDITSTKVHEKDYRFQIDAGAPQSTKATFAIGKKKSRSSIATTKKWLVKEHPQLVHQLVVSFANLRELNSDFKKLAKQRATG